MLSLSHNICANVTVCGVTDATSSNCGSVSPNTIRATATPQRLGHYTVAQRKHAPLYILHIAKIGVVLIKNHNLLH